MDSKINYDYERIKNLLEVARRDDATPLERFLCLRYLLPTGNQEYLAARIKAGDYERAFVNYAQLCPSGSKCWDLEPLHMAYQRQDELALRYLFPLRYRILLSPCECHYSVIDFLDAIMKLGCFGNIFDQFPELIVYKKRYDDHLVDETYCSSISTKCFEEVFKRYKVSRQEKDRETLVHLLARADIAMLSAFCSKIKETKKERMDIFKKIVADLPLNCRLKLIYWSARRLFYHLLEILEADLRQHVKNDILFSALQEDKSNSIWRALSLGGDIYAPDSRGNPWIVCLDAHAYWKDDKLERAYSSRIPTGTIKTVRFFDRWRMNTHIYRPSPFKALTFQLLLSIRREVGRSLPQTCITKIMEQVLANYNADFSEIDVITSEESTKSDRLFLTAAYDFIYGNANMLLAIARNLSPKDRYDAARLLAEQTWDDIHVRGTKPSFSELNTRHQALFIDTSEVDILERLRAAGLTCFNFRKSTDYLRPAYVLAFHRTYGFQTTKQGKGLDIETVD